MPTIDRSNSLRDFVSVAGPLGVSHFLLFSQTETGVQLRVARLPQGPTLSFRVMRFSLSRSVLDAQRKPADIESAFETPPLVVLNGFGSMSEGKSIPKHLQMATVMLQGMFPPMNVAQMKLSDCRRVVLFHYNRETEEVEMRHFSIRARPVGLTRAVRKIQKAKVPRLGHLDDISQYVLGAGASAGGAVSDHTSDSEMDDETAHVTLPQRYAGRGNRASQQSAVKLSEIGPRLSMRLFRIEKGVNDGEVLYHAHQTKTAKEAAALAKFHAEKKALTKARREVQEANVERKKKAREEKLARRKARREARAAEHGAEADVESGAEDSSSEEEEEEEEEGVDDGMGEGAEGNGGDDGEEGSGGEGGSDAEEDMFAEIPEAVPARKRPRQDSSAGRPAAKRQRGK